MSLLDVVHGERDHLLEEIDTAEKQLDWLKARFETLEEIAELAAKLEREGEVSAPVTVTPPVAEPAPTPASRTKPGVGRSASRTAKGGTAQSGQAHTASGAPTGGRRHAVSIEDLMPRVLDQLQAASAPLSPTALAKRLSIGKGTQTFKNVQGAVLELVKAGDARADGSLRGHATYSPTDKIDVPVTRRPERAIPAGTRLPSGVTVKRDREFDPLEQKILDLVEEKGPLAHGALCKELREMPDKVAAALGRLVPEHLQVYRSGRPAPAYGRKA